MSNNDQKKRGVKDRKMKGGEHDYINGYKLYPLRYDAEELYKLIHQLKLLGAWRTNDNGNNNNFHNCFIVKTNFYQGKCCIWIHWVKRKSYSTSKSFFVISQFLQRRRCVGYRNNN